MIRFPRLSLAVLALALFSSTAHAQLSAYGQFTVDRMSGIQSSPILPTLSPGPCPQPGGALCTSYSDAVNPLGFTGGLFYDFKTLGPARLGIDLRGSTINAHRGAESNFDGAGSHIYSGLAGLRASFHTPAKWISPYVQGSAGIARTNFGVLTNAQIFADTSATNPGIPTRNAFEYHVYAGADVPFLPYADWRVVELGYGALSSFGSYAHTYPILSISTGVVIHFPHQ